MIVNIEYHCTPITCGELVDKLAASGGDIYCVPEEFIDPCYLEDVVEVAKSWDWIQGRRRDKLLYLVDSSVAREAKTAHSPQST